MLFKNIQMAKNPFFKTLNLDRHSNLSFLTFRTTNKDIMPSGRPSAELVMDAMLNGLNEEIKKTVLAPTYRKSSDGKWVNPEEMTLVLKKVKDLEKGKIPPETAKALWDYFLLYKFVDARALQQLGETLGKSRQEIDEAHLGKGFIKLPESIANYQPFPEIIRRDQIILH